MNYELSSRPVSSTAYSNYYTGVINGIVCSWDFFIETILLFKRTVFGVYNVWS